MRRDLRSKAREGHRGARRFLAPLFVIVLAVAAILPWLHFESSSPLPAATVVPPAPPSGGDHAEEPSEEARSSQSPATPEPAEAGSSLAATLNSPSHPAAEDVEILHSLLRQYSRRLRHRQGLPIGDDIDLGRVLTGHNPMKAVILSPRHPALTADGHLRDRWGTPYFIHPRGYGAFEIRSAGPDRKLFTPDDLIANPARTESNEPLPDEPG